MFNWERVYSISGREVAARIVEVQDLAEGGHRVTLECSCTDPQGRRSNQTNTTTVFDLTNLVPFENWALGCARWLVTLLYEKPPIIKKFFAELLKPEGGHINVLADIDVSTPQTILDPCFTETAKLPRVGSAVPEENTAARIPIHRATFRFGKKEFTTDVLSLATGALCVIGQDLILKALGTNPDLLYDVFCADVVRAMRHAARAKPETVLVIGSYSEPGLSRLRAIKDLVAQHGYEVAHLSQFSDVPQQSAPQKMMLLGSLSRFIVCDEFVASGHLVELEACADNKFVTALLRPGGRAPTWMNEDIAYGRDYMRVFPYDPDQGFPTCIDEAIQWARSRADEFVAYYDSRYPWRRRNR